MSHKEMIFPTKLQHRQKFCPALLEKLFRLLQWSPVFLNIASDVCKEKFRSGNPDVGWLSLLKSYFNRNCSPQIFAEISINTEIVIGGVL